MDFFLLLFGLGFDIKKDYLKEELSSIPIDYN